MSGVSYAEDFHGSFARNATREILRRLFDSMSEGSYMRIASGDPMQSLAEEWLREAGWCSLPHPNEPADRSLHLLLVESSDNNSATVNRVVEVTSARQPWVIVINVGGCEVRALEQRLSAAGYAFMCFDGTYRYYPSSEQMRKLEPAFAESLPLEKLMPPYVFSDARIAMTLRCHDCDDIPKVANAGKVIEEPDTGPVQVMHNGIRVVADAYGGAWTTRLICLCRGHHEPQEERVFHEVVSTLPADASMIELGGYWAYYSLWFLKGGDRRRSIVVEPDPAYLEVGRRNAALNGFSPEFLAGFVGGEPRRRQPFQTESSGLVDLPCLSVPQLLAERGIDQLHLLHCDAQGAELAVLESCRELLRCGVIGWVFISTHAYQITGDPLTHQRCLALIQSLGGTLVAEHDVHESFSGDGLIVAWFGLGEPTVLHSNISRNRYSESMFRNPLYELTVANDEVTRALAATVAERALRAGAEVARVAAETRQASSDARAADAATALAEAKSARAAAEVMAAEAESALAAAEVARVAAETRQASTDARAAQAATALAEAESARAAAVVMAAEAESERAAAVVMAAEAESERAAAELMAAEARLSAESLAATAHALITEADAARDVALREVEAVRGSTSWHVTAPLRFLSGTLRRAWR